MQKNKTRNFKRNSISVAVALTLAAPFAVNTAYAGAGWGNNALITAPKVQTYYANSPSGLRPATSCFDANGVAATPVAGGLCDSGRALRKFVDTMPGLTAAGANNLGQYIPLAVPQKWVNSQGVTTNDDYYELAAVEHVERMHSDLAKATKLRGYVQLENAANKATSRHIPLTYPNGTPILDAKGVQVYGYDNPHYLGPVIVATRGVAVRIKMTNYLPVETASTGFFLPVDKTAQSAGVGPDGVTPYTDNRIAVHWHGGDAIWTSDGTAHQWFAPAGETAAYAAGMGKGASAADVPDMPATGAGEYTLYYPNNMSGRLMWYHDHASGITKLNAYAGVAAGYLIVDSVEAGMVTAGTLPSENIPLILQDKTFVPNDIAQQDAKWDTVHWGQPGDLWFAHVYETNQDPSSVDGTNPVGRWDWGPWFWPVFPAQYSLPSGVYGDVTATPEAFMDTAMVNGTAYPTMTVEPKAYRLRILNGSNDRFMNLGFYVADTTSAQALAVQAATGVLGTEVPMVPFSVPQPAGQVAFPVVGGLQGTGWGTPDSLMHPAGVPDPASIGPDIVQIGTEGGILPNAVTIPSTPINYEYNKRSVTVLNVLEHGLFMGPAERADAVVDFAPYAGKTLILYNDAPAPLPAGDPRIDYYTGAPDNTGSGGAATTLAGYGPNTRTMLRVVVAPTVTTASTFKGIPALVAALPPAYAAAQEAPLVPESAYNAAFSTTNPDTYFKIATGSLAQPTVSFASSGNQAIQSVKLVGGGTGYTSIPAVVFTNPANAAGSGAAATVGLGVGGVTMTKQGTGYTAIPTVQFTGATALGGTPATATAITIKNPTTGLYTVTGITVTSPGSYTVMPSVAFVLPAGAKATTVATATAKSSGQITSLTMTNAGTGYTAAPAISFVGGGGIGAMASAVTSGTITLPVLNKGIQELFDPIYGRMNATFSIELPMTTAANQTTVPVAYVDPTTETINDGETQIWKITHNGVDSHPVHFHLVNVQVINRVGWDGTIKPPYDNEMGWKETVRMNPLEDIYVAARAKKPVTPGFGLPESYRLRDPSQPWGSTLGFSQFDFSGSPVVGSANYNPNFGTTVPAGTVFNDYENFDNEYVWHCHILGHEEFDFMRPIAFHPYTVDATVGSPTLGQWVKPGTNALAVPAAPTIGTATVAASGVTVTWTDNSTTEYQFSIERAPVTKGVVGVFAAVGTALANATSFVDTTAVAGASYAYQVVAVGAKGTATSATVTAAAPVVVNAPTALAAVATSATTATLSWTDNATNETAYLVSVNGGAATTITRTAAQGTATGAVSTTVTIAGPGTYTFTVTAINVTGAVTTSSAAVSLTSTFAVLAAPAAPTATAVTATGLTLNWTAVAGAAGYTVYQNGVALTAVAGTAVTRNITGLTAATAYTYTVTANNAVGASAKSAALNVTTAAAPAVPAVPAAPTATAVTATGLTLNWTAVTGATGYSVYQNGVRLAAVAGTAVTRNITGLTAATAYTFTVTANNAVGASAQSAALVVTTAAASVVIPATPAAPTAVAGAAGSKSAIVSWTAVAGVTNYNVMMSTRAANGTWGAPVIKGVVAVAAAGPVVYTATGLTTGTRYRFSLSAVNAAGTSAVSANSATVTAP